MDASQRWTDPGGCRVSDNREVTPLSISNYTTFICNFRFEYLVGNVCPVIDYSRASSAPIFSYILGVSYFSPIFWGNLLYSPIFSSLDYYLLSKSLKIGFV